MEEVATTEGFAARNVLLLRNTSIGNFFDLCAISLPLRLGNSLPCGLMLFGRHGDDRKLFQVAAAVEKALAASAAVEASDPVSQSVSANRSAAAYWMLAFAGMTAELHAIEHFIVPMPSMPHSSLSPLAICGDAGGRAGHDDVAGADRNLLRQL